MPNNLGLTIAIGATIGAATAALSGVKGTLDKLNKATQHLKAGQRALGQEMQAAARQPRTDIAQINQQYEKQKKLLTELRARREALGRAEARVNAAQMNREKLRGRLMETAGLAYLAAKPLQIGIEFEASMSKVQALTRLDKNSPEIKALTGQARELGKKTAFTAAEAAQAQGFLAMAGFKPEQILQSMPSMLDLAKAGGTDLQRTADIASNIQTAYGLDASQMTRIADTLTKAFTTSNVDLEMLSQTMKYVGPVAKAAGMSLEEAASMAGMLGNAGIQADMAGTALRGMLSKISGTGAKKLKALGVSALDAAGNMRSLPEVMADLQKATANMGSGERVKTIFSIFDQRAGPAVMALLDNVKDMAPYIDTVKNSEGAAAKTAAIMADNTQGALIEMKSAWEDLCISITDGEKGAFRELIQSITDGLRSLSSWVQENEEAVGWALKIAAGLLALKAAALAAGYAFSLIASPFLKGIVLFRKFQAALSLLSAGGAFLKLASGLRMVGSVFMALGRALLMNPIGLIIMAIAVAAYLIYENWDPIKAWFIKMWGLICEAFSAAGQWISGVWDTISSGIQAGWEWVKSAFSGALEWLGGLDAKFREFGVNLLMGLKDGIVSKATEVIDYLKDLGGRMWQSVKETLGIASPSKVFMELGRFTLQGLAEGLKAAASLPLSAMNAAVAPMIAAGTLAVAGASPPALAAPAGGGGPAAITVNVWPSPGMDEKALAALVARKIEEAGRAAEARRRARLSDAD